MPPKFLDGQVLHHPFEEDFNLPAVSVAVRRIDGGNLGIVGDEEELAVVVCIMVYHQPRRMGIEIPGFHPSNTNDVIVTHTAAGVKPAK